jgi:hypothetical protein
MAQFRKKPVVVEAIEWTGHNQDEICAFSNGKAQVFGGPFGLTAMFVKTLEGNMQANVGDWIIRGVAGEFNPCKPDIFAATYEAMT